MNEAEFFYRNYPYIKDARTLDDCINMMERFKDKIISRIESGSVVFLALYLKLNDVHFNAVKDSIKNASTPEFIEKSILNEGDNVHFAIALGNPKYILNCLKEVIRKENPKTVSWYKPDMKKIHLIKLRGQLCHQ